MAERMTEIDFRIQKANQLRELWINPYAAKFDKQQNIGQLIFWWNNSSDYRNIDDIVVSTNKTVSTAWRLTLFRPHWKLSFGRLQDEFGEIQIMWHRDNCSLIDVMTRHPEQSEGSQKNSESSPKISLNFRDDNRRNEIISWRKTIERRVLNPEEPERFFGNVKKWDIIEFVHVSTWEKRNALVKQTYLRHGYEEILAYKNLFPQIYWSKLDQNNISTPAEVKADLDLIATNYSQKFEEKWLIGFEFELLWDEESESLLRSSQWRNPYKMIEKFLDVGDIIWVQWELFVTHKGELTIFVSDYQLLSKAIRPLGDKFHGIGEDNQETAYRQRYLDMIFNRESLQRMKLRSKFIRTLRNYYEESNFIELETPILWNSASGAAARPFVTHHNDLDQDMYLRIALECPLKMATVGMLERVFELWKVFRNEWSDPSHIQEYTSCEHYATYWNYEDNMIFTEKMFDYIFEHIPELQKKVQVIDKAWVSKEIDFQTPWRRVDFIAQVKIDSGIDVSKYTPHDEEKLRNLIKEKWHNWEWLDVQTTATMIDYLYKKVTRPKIVWPAFIFNYPKTMQPLARQSDNNSNIVEQRQLLVNGRELIKAYSELVDPIQQQTNFDEQAGAVAKWDDEATKADTEFVTAMEYGMPPQSWRGMGIDRILALLTEQQNIRDVVMFPIMKPTVGTQNVASVNGDDGRNAHAARLDNVVATHSNTSADKTDLSKEDVKNYIPTVEGSTIVWPFGDTDPEIWDELVQQAENLVQKYSTETQWHLRQVWGLMKHFAKKLGRNENYWYIVWLLHDIDWDYIGKDAARHIQDDLENIIFELNCSDEIKNQLIIDIQSHGPWLSGVEATTTIQKYLISIDELSGLMFAYSRMRWGFDGMEVKWVMKKVKDKAFAAGVDREHVRNCETYLGVALEDFVGQMIEGFLGL